MSKYFSAEEIFDIAIQIEKNGASFYAQIAQKISEPAIKEEIKKLAQWEESHILQMAALKKKYSTETATPLQFHHPEEEQQLYLQEIANQHIFVQNRDLSPLLKGVKTTRDYLEIALRFEHDSATFYGALADELIFSEAQQSIQEILVEEESHVVQIQRLIKAL